MPQSSMPSGMQSPPGISAQQAADINPRAAVAMGINPMAASMLSGQPMGGGMPGQGGMGSGGTDENGNPIPFNGMNPDGDEDEDGGMWIDISDGDYEFPLDSSDHYKNLAEVIPDHILSSISATLLRDIEDDNQSRQEWLQMRDQAIGLLGLKIQQPKTDINSSASPFEGMSSYQDGALLESCVRFQANARGELLPSGGPVKVYTEGQSSQQKDLLAEALEKAVNAFLTVGSPEYVPDTDKLFFQLALSGAAFKKGFHCPIRRRPVIESIDAKDLIISAQATDIDTATRVTHINEISYTAFRRMQICGAYRDIDIDIPTEKEKTVVDNRIENIQGIKRTNNLSSSIFQQDRVLFECYVDYDIPGLEHKIRGKITGLPLPYKIVIDKTSRQILEIRRNWAEDDEQCNKKKTFIMYPFVPGMSFWPLGLMHLMGNTTNAITAALRIAIDNGMINNFPYWLYAKTGTQQDKNDFRAGPGQGIPINVPVGGKIGDMLSPAPTKQLDPSFIQIVQMLKSDSQRIGGTAEIQIGEGKQEAPVGTTVALIEQATKVISAVHKRLHQAQAEEFRMLRDLLQEDPEALWRHVRKRPDNYQIIISALNDYELIPQADPNVSSHIVRIQKAELAKQLVMQSPPGMWDFHSATQWYCDQIGIPELKKFLTPPQPPVNPQAMQPPMGAGAGVGGPDPLKAISAIKTQQMKSNDAESSNQLKYQIAQQEQQMRMYELQQKAQSEEADRQQRAQEAQMNLSKELVIHPVSPEMLQQTYQTE